ncbi:MAG TPA: hypothetical protein DCS44_09180 [Cyanobacteria bacterium UBA10660]|nr:MAG TPA: hypothetical protein CPT83_03935 [Candidatus Gastranaerophilales bacterium HUM_1]HAS94764.1 hypothetical protein [Cyanobacteria bacterium UBA10660]
MWNFGSESSDRIIIVADIHKVHPFERMKSLQDFLLLLGCFFVNFYYEKLKNWQILFFRYFLYIVKVAKGSN